MLKANHSRFSPIQFSNPIVVCGWRCLTYRLAEWTLCRICSFNSMWVDTMFSELLNFVYLNLNNTQRTCFPTVFASRFSSNFHINRRRRHYFVVWLGFMCLFCDFDDPKIIHRMFMSAFSAMRFIFRCANLLCSFERCFMLTAVGNRLRTINKLFGPNEQYKTQNNLESPEAAL